MMNGNNKDKNDRIRRVDGMELIFDCHSRLAGDFAIDVEGCNPLKTQQAKLLQCMLPLLFVYEAEPANGYSDLR